jgi:hypothetical protein
LSNLSVGEALLLELGRVVQRAQGLAMYLIQNGLVLKDGDTFDAPNAEGFTVRLGDSERFRGLAVIAANLSTE